MPPTNADLWHAIGTHLEAILPRWPDVFNLPIGEHHAVRWQQGYILAEIEEYLAQVVYDRLMNFPSRSTEEYRQMFIENRLWQDGEMITGFPLGFPAAEQLEFLTQAVRNFIWGLCGEFGVSEASLVANRTLFSAAEVDSFTQPFYWELSEAIWSNAIPFLDLGGPHGDQEIDSLLWVYRNDFNWTGGRPQFEGRPGIAAENESVEAVNTPIEVEEPVLFDDVAAPCDIPADDQRCAICIEDLGPDHLAVRTVYNHIFGSECLENWILAFRTAAGQPNCPMCRQNLQRLSQ